MCVMEGKEWEGREGRREGQKERARERKEEGGGRELYLHLGERVYCTRILQ